MGWNVCKACLLLVSNEIWRWLMTLPKHWLYFILSEVTKASACFHWSYCFYRPTCLFISFGTIYPWVGSLPFRISGKMKMLKVNFLCNLCVAIRKKGSSSRFLCMYHGYLIQLLITQFLKKARMPYKILAFELYISCRSNKRLQNGGLYKTFVWLSKTLVYSSPILTF